MNYKLAKKLKDAGFTFNKCDLDYCACGAIEYESIIIDEIHYWNPTLSGLIEACGDNFSHLVRYYKQSKKDKLLWEAEEPSRNIGFKCEMDCNTPEEAVATLWLRLNKIN